MAWRMLRTSFLEKFMLGTFDFESRTQTQPPVYEQTDRTLCDVMGDASIFRRTVDSMYMTMILAPVIHRRGLFPFPCSI
jgi:hypothetical protein